MIAWSHNCPQEQADQISFPLTGHSKVWFIYSRRRAYWVGLCQTILFYSQINTNNCPLVTVYLFIGPFLCADVQDKQSDLHEAGLHIVPVQRVSPFNLLQEHRLASPQSHLFSRQSNGFRASTGEIHQQGRFHAKLGVWSRIQGRCFWKLAFCLRSWSCTSIISLITTFTCRNDSEIGSRRCVGLFNLLLSAYLCELTC